MATPDLLSGELKHSDEEKRREGKPSRGKRPRGAHTRKKAGAEKFQKTC